MRLFSTIAAAAAVSSAVAADVPAGRNYTFSGLTSTTASGSKPQTLTQVTASTSAGQAVQTASSSLSVLSDVKVAALLKLSLDFKFEIRGGLCVITNMPAEAAVVSWRLVYDLDVKGTFYFEICEPQDQSRVVTKVQGQYIYGMAVSHNATATGAVDLICDNGGLSHFRVENKQVVEVEAKATVSVAANVYQCSNVAKCQQSPCQEDKCRVNVLAKVDAPVATVANATAPAKASAKAPAKGPETAPAPALVAWEFEECKTGCFRVQTCAESACVVHEAAKGPAPAPVPVDKVVPTLPGAAAAPKQDVQPRPNAGQNTPVAPAATNRPAAAGVTNGSGRLVVALNVLAGVVGLALFL